MSRLPPAGVDASKIFYFLKMIIALVRSVLGIGSGVARFLMIAEYATYRYLRCVGNVMLLLSQLSVSFDYYATLFLINVS